MTPTSDEEILELSDEELLDLYRYHEKQHMYYEAADSNYQADASSYHRRMMHVLGLELNMRERERT